MGAAARKIRISLPVCGHRLLNGANLCIVDLPGKGSRPECKDGLVEGARRMKDEEKISGGHKGSDGKRRFLQE
ncbi:hypothetical protein ACFX13_021299 [Malus domestica]